MSNTSEHQIRQLDLWKGPLTIEPIGGGITNRNFVVSDQGRKFFVRMGNDIPLHGVMRFNELQASRAGANAGLSPAVVHHAPGILVLDFVEGKTLTEEDVRQDTYLEQIVPMLHTCHHELAQQVRGPALIFWVFHVIRDYMATLRDDDSRMRDALPALLAKSCALEKAVGAVNLVYGHNDLLAANFIDDGKRLWLIDWDYAGYNSPLFDLANLASNNGLSPDQEDWLLARYFGSAVSGKTRRAFEAMKCASLLRESLWSMVSEIHSGIDFDFVEYTRENLERFDQQWRSFDAAKR
ncbi:MAG: phosphotransferase [Arenicellales bacterium]|jgi:thiamine kinase-like enzyme|nr:phosphotransferase [Arenicellales bacterium]MDP6552865.1 phosphotransferase [Arenicellales bacterium]MDP6791061.1 phosphotransferase [Arenicellales bacterium]MDP6919069.1 phosphotransferase [Arenicellales bacterium]|tara:strand:- start:2009 stop:2893 length:885 start_codon:yes stop_codon:yes gene_type:complete